MSICAQMFFILGDKLVAKTHLQDIDLYVEWEEEAKSPAFIAAALLTTPLCSVLLSSELGRS